jgi:hypothetical protein
MVASLQRPNLLILGQTLQSLMDRKTLVVAQFWHRIWHGRGKTGCDRGDSLRRGHKALEWFSVVVVVLRRDRGDPLGRRHPPTDQKVGGSNPSERAKVLVTGLQISV